MAQTPVIDSLRKVSATAEKQMDRAYAYQRLAWLHILKDSKAALAFNDTAHVMYTNLKDEEGIAQTNYKFGVIYRYTGDYIKAHERLNRYRTYVAQEQDSFGLGDVAYQKGVVYSLQGDYENSLAEYFETLRWYELKKDSASYGFTWNSIGLIQKNLERYEEALTSFEKAQYFNLKFDKKADVADAYNSMASIYFIQKKLDTSEILHKKSLAIDLEIDNQWGIAMSYFNLGSLEKFKRNKARALFYYQKAAEIQKLNNYTKDLTETQIGMAELFRDSKEFKKAETLLSKALLQAANSNASLKKIHLLHSEVSEQLGDTKSAVYHLKQYNKANDAILNEESIKQINLLTQRYEATKKEEEIAVQQLQLSEQQALLNRKKQQFRWAMAGVVALIGLLLGSWFVYNQRQKRKAQELIALRKQSEVETLESLIQGEEKERLRIAQELHDGVNGDLSAIKYKLNELATSNQQGLKEAVAMLDKSCEQVRAISHNLVPPALENFDLRAATSDYCYKMNANYAPEVVFQYLGDTALLPKEVEVNMYRIVQELVTNALKHAKANEIHVQLSANNKILQLTVEDDGVGFEANKISNQGIGLKNIASRVDYLGGELDIVSNNEGTSVSVLLTKNQLDD